MSISEIPPLSYRSLTDAVTDHLRRAIINGMFAAGRRLPETEIAEMFQVSRATIRHALARLETERLVAIRPRRGAVVTRMSRAEGTEVCEARLLLEAFAVREAIQMLQADDLAQMRAMAQGMGAALSRQDVMRVVELDMTFHRKIAACTHNERVLELWEELNSQLGALLSLNLEVRELTPEKVRDRHLGIVDALETREPETFALALQQHYVDIWPHGVLQG